MAETSNTESLLTEPLTWQQICERYPSQWVVLVDIEKDPEDYSINFHTARVAGVGKSLRDSMDHGRAFERGYSGWKCPFTGTVTRSIAHLLR